MFSKKPALILLLLAGLVFSCAGYISHYVPAVVGDSGDLVPVSVKAVDGSGVVYLSTLPNTGVSTQESFQDSVGYVMSITSSRCDILVRIGDSGMMTFVDGPSGGALVAVLAYAAIENKSINTDAIITGSVDSEGNILPVGGLPEKIRASETNGFDYFLTPPQSLHEKILLAPMKQAGGIEIMEAENVSQAIDFFVYGILPIQRNVTYIQLDYPDIDSYDYSDNDMEKFRELSLNLIEKENKTISSIADGDSDVHEIKNQLQNNVNRQLFILEKGYLFTAANDAFLTYIDSATIAEFEGTGTIDLTKKKYEIDSCLSSIPSYQKGPKNFEWVIGSDLRKTWAVDKSGSSDIYSAVLIEEKYFAYNELMYADGWCDISKSLLEAIEGSDYGSYQFDETLWKDLALSKILEADTLEISDQNLNDHLITAKKSFEDGKYGASIYDTTFVLSNYYASLEYDSSEVDVSQYMLSAKHTERKSLWGKIYQSHAVYLYQLAPGDLTAYQLFKYSEALDEVTDQMLEIQENNHINTETQTDNVETEDIPLEYAIVLIAIGIMLVILITFIFYVLESALLKNWNKKK